MYVKDVTFEMFLEEFDRQGKGGRFSEEGLRKLYVALPGYDSNGEPIELSVTDTCCDYTEVSGLEEFRTIYGPEFRTMDDVISHFTVIPVGEGFIVQE